MRSAPDHAGLEALPLEACLRLLASVPLGRVGFHSDGELVVLPVNYAVDGQDVVFRTGWGSKLSAAEAESLVVFEADDYDARTRTGWSVLMKGRATAVYEDADIRALDAVGLRSWTDSGIESFWIRIRPTELTGRMLLSATQDGAPGAGAGGGHVAPQVFDVLHGQAMHTRCTPFGQVGTVFSGSGAELVWVSKLGEVVDKNWFSSHEVDLILVIQGQLKFEFESPGEQDRVLGVGEVLVLPADTRCRAYRWPREASEATIFVAFYPTSRTRQHLSVAGSR
jgi:uncharacterized protein